ncbi:unnamed protein product [Parajaminaea phylloscopi]
MAYGGEDGDPAGAREQEQPLMGSHSAASTSADPASRPLSARVEMANGRRKPLKFTERMWIIATASLVSFLAFSSQFCVLIPYWRSLPTVSTLEILCYLIPFNCGVALIFYNYYLVVFTSPGDVPPDWEPDWDSIGGVEVKASTASPRYCKVCRSYKPPRAHHCRSCKRCVLRMDHHCPWVANCVGHGNYGHFLRFLWAVDLTMIMHLLLLGLRVADWWSPYALWREPSTFAMVIMVLNFAQGVPVLLMVGVFSLYHTYALCTNTTTIESWEKDKVAMLIRRGKIEEVKYPYDLGIKANIQSILGRSAAWWCWPGQKPLGDGLDYHLGHGHAHLEQFFWPPRDPTRPQRYSNKPKGRFRLPERGPFTYGQDGFNPALVPSNSRAAAAARGAATGQANGSIVPYATGAKLRQRGSPQGQVPGDGANPAAFTDEWSSVSPYHPSYRQRAGGGHSRSSSPSGSSRSSESESAAEEAGVVNAGCIPPGTIPGSGKRPGDVRRPQGQQGNGRDDQAVNGGNSRSSTPEEHELMAASEARRWGANSGEVFPRLFAEEGDDDDEGDSDQMGSEGYGAFESGSDDDDDDDAARRPSNRGPQLHSRVRRGSEGYEVRPMMYDAAYAADLQEEEDRLREYLMAERERLGQVWDPESEHFGEDERAIYGVPSGMDAQYDAHFHDGHDGQDTSTDHDDHDDIGK